MGKSRSKGGGASIVAAAVAVNGPWNGRIANSEEPSDCESTEDADCLADTQATVEQPALDCQETCASLAVLAINQESQEEPVASASDIEELDAVVGLHPLM